MNILSMINRIISFPPMTMREKRSMRGEVSRYQDAEVDISKELISSDSDNVSSKGYSILSSD